MKTLKKLGLLCGLISFFAFAAPVNADDQFGDEWKISVSGSAVTAGSISFSLNFEPDNDGSVRDPISIDTSVAANASKEDIVSLIGNAFSSALAESDFNVDISWGEHIEVEAAEDTANFALTITKNTLQGVSIKIKN